MLSQISNFVLNYKFDTVIISTGHWIGDSIAGGHRVIRRDDIPDNTSVSAGTFISFDIMFCSASVIITTL